MNKKKLIRELKINYPYSLEVILQRNTFRSEAIAPINETNTNKGHPLGFFIDKFKDKISGWIRDWLNGITGITFDWTLAEKLSGILFIEFDKALFTDCNQPQPTSPIWCVQIPIRSSVWVSKQNRKSISFKREKWCKKGRIMTQVHGWAISSVLLWVMTGLKNSPVSSARSFWWNFKNLNIILQAEHVDNLPSFIINGDFICNIKRTLLKIVSTIKRFWNQINWTDKLYNKTK